MPYHNVNTAELPRHKLHKAIKTGKIALTAAEVENTGTGVLHHRHHLLLHPENHKKLHKARKERKGVHLELTGDEIRGSGVFGDILNGIGKVGSTVYNGVKKGVDFIGKHKDLIGSIADVGTALVGPEAIPYRAGLKEITGIGIHKTHHKSKEETYKKRVAALKKAREAKKHHSKGGSFLAAGY